MILRGWLEKWRYGQARRLQAKQIEAQVLQWLVAMDVLNGRLQLLHSQPRTVAEPPEGLLEALQGLQQEVSHYQQSVQEVEEWWDNRLR